MKRSVLLLLIVLSLGWAAAPARADDTYSQTFDNSGSYPEITIIQGTHNAFGYLNGVRGASSSDWIEFTIDFGEEKSITSFQFDVYHVSSNSNHISFVWWQFDGTGTQVAQYAQYTQVVAPDIWHTRSAMFDSTKPTRYYKFLLWHTRSTPGAIHIDNLVGAFFEEVGELGRPLLASDESPLWPYADQDLVQTGVALRIVSDLRSAHVYSVEAGTVTQIRRLTGEMCFLYFACIVNMDPITGFPRMPAWEVRVLTSDGDEYGYYVDDAPSFVVEGQIIRVGCIIGRTFPVKASKTWTYSISGGISGSGPNASIGAMIRPGEYFDEGVAFIIKAVDGQPVSIVNDIAVYPTLENACNVREEFRECEGDAALESASNWQTRGDVSELSPGFVLGFNASISREFNLSADRLPRLRVEARSMGTTSRMRLRLGETVETFDVSYLDLEYRIEAGEHDPDRGLFFTVSVQNLSSTSILIRWACVSHFLTEDLEEREDPPANCYFGNASFTDNSVWASAGTVYAYPGEYRMDSGALIYQPVRLYPGDYVISVEAAIWHLNSYTMDDTDTSTTLTLEYDWPQDSSYTLIESATIADMASYGNTFTFTAQIVVATTDEGQFVIRPTLSSTPSGVQGISIREACLNPVGDGWPPNPDGPPPGGEPEGPFNENCTPNPRPSGEGISSWFTWHWLNFRGFFSCELMILLNDMYKLGVNTYKLIGWSARWSQSSVMIGADWISTDAIYWAEGHFANMALGRETFIQVNESQNCSNLWCAIGALFGTVDGIFDNLADVIQSVLENVFGPLIAFIINLVNTTIGFVFSLIIALINIGIYLISVLITAVARVLSLFTGLIDAWNNAEPEPIPGLPSCYYDPRQSGFCMVLHGMEQTIFSGRGALLIPLLIGFGSIHMLLWTIKEFKHTLLETGKAL